MTRFEILNNRRNNFQNLLDRAQDVYLKTSDWSTRGAAEELINIYIENIRETDNLLLKEANK